MPNICDGFVHLVSRSNLLMNKDSTAIVGVGIRDDQSQKLDYPPIRAKTSQAKPSQ
jgi:hypothetical protein